MTEETMGMVIALGTAAVSAAGGVLVEKYLAQPPTSSPPPPPPTSIMAVRPLTAAGVKASAPSDNCAAPPAAAAAATVAAPASSSQAASSLLWEQQGVLALFSAAFADLYVLLFLRDAVRGRELLRGWTPMTAVVMLLQAVQGILVARAIQRWGIVFRLILGTISICLCIIAEGILYMEPVVFREMLSIVLVMIGSSMYYYTSAPSVCAQCARKGPEGMPEAAEGVLGGTHSKGVGGGGTRLRRHSPTPLEERGAGPRRWW
jgi:hypothetical protein